MKNSHLLILLLFTPLTFFAQVGIDNNNPHPASVLDLSGSVNESKGLLIPKVNSLGEVIIDTAGADGMLVYLKGEEKFYCYDESENNWVMVNPFRKVNGDNVAYVPGNVTVSDTLQSSAVSTDQLVVPGFSHNALVPSGVIVMWSGTIPPTGWKICDGTNGTPNLRGRFIIGALPGAPVFYNNPGDLSEGGSTNGNTGGNTNIRLTSNQLPAHRHDMSHGHGVSDLGHEHKVPKSDDQPLDRGLSGSNIRQKVSFAIKNDSPKTEKVETGITINNMNGNTGSTGLGNTIDITPPYYVLAYIMKE